MSGRGVALRAAAGWRAHLERHHGPAVSAAPSAPEARVTEAGEARVTEDGEARTIEAGA